MAQKPTSQRALIFSFFKENAHRDIPHQEVVDWATREHLKRFKTVFRDPDRAIRMLHQLGHLIKVKKGVYRYDPNHIAARKLDDFDAKTKRLVLDRDGHRCVVCDRGVRDGVELHVDHVLSRDSGGRATVDNGQTLCAQHNFMKKNYGQFEFGARMFVRTHEYAVKIGDVETAALCREIIAVLEKHGKAIQIKFCARKI